LLTKELGKALSGAAKAALANPAVRKAAQEAFATAIASSASLLAVQLKHVAKARSDDASDDSPIGQNVTPGFSAVREDFDEDPGMATLGELEESIHLVERVTVSFVHRTSGRDVRDDRRGFTPYAYQKKASDDFTVSDFIRRRLAGHERSGLKAVVRLGNGKAAHGATKLREVRKGYE
jgi:hypothetical protein